MLKLDFNILNQSQYEAVMYPQGPLLVLAGAGSGKTRVIMYRIARLIQDGVEPYHILGVTFTNKAANQMRQRLKDLIGRNARHVHLLTFHALGLSILQEEHHAAGLQANFGIYDMSDQLSLVRDLMRKITVADRRLDAARVLDIILRTKRLRHPEVQIDWGDDYELAAFDLYPSYLAQMRAFNAIDFDDLILRSQDILNQPEIKTRWEKRFLHVLVDEYQDTSPDQFALVHALTHAHQNICAVGDDDQAIYAWRGAAVDNILSFSKHFLHTHEVVLDQNYRSTNNILLAANHIIKHNKKRKEKTLWSASGDGAPVEIVTCSHGEDEAIFVAEMILRLQDQGVPFSSMAVLYRANAQSRMFEDIFAAENIPFQIIGGQAFFDRKDVRDAMAYLAVVHNPADDLSLRRIINVPSRGIGHASLDKLLAYATKYGVGLWGALQQAHSIQDLPKAAQVGAQTLVDMVTHTQQRCQCADTPTLVAAVEALFAQLHLREAILTANDPPALTTKRLDNLQEVPQSLQRFLARHADVANPLAAFLRATSLINSLDDKDDEHPDNKVTLMTLHSAKGLEFQYVWMVGMEEDLLPHKRSLQDTEHQQSAMDLSEERRLCYVGMTRARKRLWLTWAKERMLYGRMHTRSPSRFLSDLPVDDTHIVAYSRADTLHGPTSMKAQEESEAMVAMYRKKIRLQLGIGDHE